MPEKPPSSSSKITVRPPEAPRLPTQPHSYLWICDSRVARNCELYWVYNRVMLGLYGVESCPEQWLFIENLANARLERHISLRGRPFTTASATARLQLSLGSVLALILPTKLNPHLNAAMRHVQLACALWALCFLRTPQAFEMTLLHSRPPLVSLIGTVVLCSRLWERFGETLCILATQDPVPEEGPAAPEPPPECLAQICSLRGMAQPTHLKYGHLNLFKYLCPASEKTPNHQ